jgi:hypothetical protein
MQKDQQSSPAASVAEPDNAAGLPKFPFARPSDLVPLDFGRHHNGPAAFDLCL